MKSEKMDEDTGSPLPLTTAPASTMQQSQPQLDGGNFGGSGLLMEEFTLRWDPHDARLSESMTRAWEKKLFLDVTLASGARTVGAHRLVLCACSSLFESLLAGPTAMQQHPNPLLCFNDVDYEDLCALVEFMYRGSITVTRKALPSLIHAARVLRIRGLSLDESSDSPPESTGGSEPSTLPTIPTKSVLPAEPPATAPSRKRRKPAADQQHKAVAIAPTDDAARPEFVPSTASTSPIPIDPSVMADMSDQQRQMAAFLSALASGQKNGLLSPGNPPIFPQQQTPNGPSPLRPRLVWDPAHLDYLERWYCTETRYPSIAQSQLYANQLSLIPHSDPSGRSKKVMFVTAQNVSHWFQNRRRKDNHPEIEEKRVKRGAGRRGSRKKGENHGNDDADGNAMGMKMGPLDLTQQHLVPPRQHQETDDDDQDDDNSGHLCIADQNLQHQSDVEDHQPVYAR